MSVAAFGRMADAGVFHPEARLELIDGEILEMSPIKPPHGYAVDVLTMELIHQLGDRGVVRTQGSVVTDDYSQPRPDITVSQPPIQRYRAWHPHPDDVLLVIEVADSTLRFDRNVKIPLYGRDGIREAWLVDIPHRGVEVFTQPTAQGDATTVVHERGDLVGPIAFPDVRIAVADLMPLDDDGAG